MDKELAKTIEKLNYHLKNINSLIKEIKEKNPGITVFTKMGAQKMPNIPITKNYIEKIRALPVFPKVIITVFKNNITRYFSNEED